MILETADNRALNNTTCAAGLPAGPIEAARGPTGWFSTALLSRDRFRPVAAGDLTLCQKSLTSDLVRCAW
jgi:hypothetical protein